jgi:sec-independent protein translocase protein TatC
MRSGREIDPKVMSFLGHLEELRQVFFSVVIAVLIGTVVCWFFSGYILDWIVTHTIGQAQFLRPAEAFSTRVKIALFFGFLLSFPYLALRIWSFVGPGLFRSERAVVVPAALSSTGLFVAGMAFSYFVLTPMMLKLLVRFGTAHVSANIAVGFLMGFILKMSLATGLLFQLPLAVAVLTRFGLVTPGSLWKRWRHAVLIIFIVAAVVTPGDGPSQIVLATPVIVLYFASIWVSSVIARGQRRREREAAELEAAERKPAEGGPSGSGGESS